MFHRGEPYFYAFDLLWLDGVDLRDLPLVERKATLRELVPPPPSHLLYLDHINGKVAWSCTSSAASSTSKEWWPSLN